MGVAAHAPLDRESLVDDTELVEALKAGYEWAFESLVRSSSGRMLAVARRYARTEEDARDIVQAAYLNAFRAMSQFNGHARLSTWLHRIVVNTALMKLRSQRRRPEEPIESLLPAFQRDGHHVEQFADGGPTAEDLLQRQDTRRVVRECIGRLPVGYRTVLLLRDIEGRPAGEVAASLGLTPAGVKTRLHRARQALATQLRHRYAQPAGTLAPAAASNS